MPNRKSLFSLGSQVTLQEVFQVAHRKKNVVFSPPQRSKVKTSRNYLENVLRQGETVYGVNTGFGELASTRISPEEVRQLQKNFVSSHACGIGEPLSEQESRAMLFLRTNELARGFSGVRVELVSKMADLLNRGAAPRIPSQGSVGASGDLAPLAHMALAIRKIIELEAKEGLSLTNGTQAMQAVGALALGQAFSLWETATLSAAMSLEALKGTPLPYEAPLHELKPHAGQKKVARRLLELLRGSQIRESHREDDPRVQDPYSLRCVPQVHGAVWDVLGYARSVVEIEMNSVTDNPVVVGRRIFSGGNFHGQGLAFAFDFAATALTALGNISERRIFQLVSDRHHILPPFLASQPGLESGWMIAQVLAASLASENKVLAHPASADSIPTSGNQEDFVSMGMTAAMKFRKIVQNVAGILAVEVLAASQGIETHRPLGPGYGVAAALQKLRRVFVPTRGDQVLGPSIEKLKFMILEGYLIEI
ncbi:MAG: aromatic amino acid lyase [Elusimicrobia bacterium]|nr:aromatic amino acid lyase [Elusimicrobiota bacterium]